MELNKKTYELGKTKKYLQSNKIVLLANEINKNLRKEFGYQSYKIFNKAALKTIKNSVYKHNKLIVNGTTFFFKPPLKLTTTTFQQEIRYVLFMLSALKINNKLYSPIQLQKLSSINYSYNKLLLNQVVTTTLKNYSK